MRPKVWSPPVELSDTEEAIAKRVRRGKLFVFLRHERHRLFSSEFQKELGTIYKESAFGQPPIPPAQLALATILQAYVGVSDDEVIEATLMDRRWQLVLDCLDCAKAPFSKGTLVAFRQRLIEHDFDRRLIERTIEVAEETGGFGSRQLRAALDSSPLWGAGRVEDTYNLLGHALRKALGVIAHQRGRELTDLAQEAGASILGSSSIKAALDVDWDNVEDKQHALQVMLDTLTSVEAWVMQTPEGQTDHTVQESLQTAHQVRDQDVTVDEEGKPTLRQGVAPDRRISVEDPEMRHGRKSRHKRIDGYKRHVLSSLDSRLIHAVGITPANAPEASVTDQLAADLAHQQVILAELHMDRAYLNSTMVRNRSPELVICCKAWAIHRNDQFPKTVFQWDWQKKLVRCPNGVERSFEYGKVVRFPATACSACPQRAQCTQSPRGRTVSVHQDERLLDDLRQRQQTSAGRAKLRERVSVEHTLSHVGHWQGDTARYCGVRKNLFDLRRVAVVNNLFVMTHLPSMGAA